MQREVHLRKTLPIYYLVDTGSQMAGDKIGAVNSAMEEAITVDLPDISTTNDDAEIRVAIIQFSNGASWVTPGVVPFGDLIWNDLHASGANDFGQALHLLAEELKFFDPYTNFAPIVVAFSNAAVTDEYTEKLNRLNQMECFRNGHKIGIAIGEDADRRALKAFTGSSEAILAVNDKHTLKSLMRKTNIEVDRMIDLKTILQQHPNCLNSRASFKSVLMDKYPSERRMVNILTILFECGVANKIKSKKSINTNEMQGLIAQIENEYGISGQYSQEAILIWAAAFDVTASAIKTQSPITAPKEQTKQIEQKPVVYVQGNVDDYELVKRTDGYYISRFNGFEETEMIIPSLIDGKKITGIAESVFEGCSTVKKIYISEGIEVIEDSAFKDCKQLEEVILPNTLRQIGNKPEKSVYKTKGAFSETKLKEIIIPQNVEFLGAKSFYGCFDLKKVILSNKIVVINDSTFEFCINLSEITFPESLSAIGEQAFKSCARLCEINIPIGTRIIAASAFVGTSLTSAYIPPTVSRLGDNVFGYNEKLTIYCTPGSAVLDYARKHGIKYAKAQSY